MIAALLRPDGRFHMREGHPLLWTLDGEGNDLRLRHPYFHDGTPTRWVDPATYTDGDHSAITHTETYEWQHTLGDVLSSLLAAGLRITAFEEHPFADWMALDDMVERDRFWWLPPGRERALPLTYMVTAERA